MPKLSPRITTTILHGQHNHWRNHAKDLLNIFKEKSPLIKKHLKLPKNVEIRMRIIPLRMKASGLAYPPQSNNKRYIVDVDVRQSRRSFFHTLLHELVHIEQYHTNKLIINDCDIMWKGKTFKPVNNVYSLNYKKQPWEIEANKKADKLYKYLKA